MSSKVCELYDIESMVDDLRVLDAFFDENPKLTPKCLNPDGYMLDSYELIRISRTASVLSMRIAQGLDSFLITEQGQLDLVATNLLERRGFVVEVVSRDRFGPLGAALIARNYKLSFG